jgi:signal transduction histidine kinase
LQLKKKGPYHTLFSGHAKEVGIICTILIIAVSYGLFFYQQNVTEASVRNGLFVEQRERQLESTEAMAQHIGSDLSSVASILQGLADSSYLQQGELYGDRVDKLMNERFDQINNITRVDGLFIADSDDIITYNIVTEGHRSFVNIDISFRDYVQETKKMLRPVFSEGFEGIDGIYRIAIIFPIVNRENSQYIGMVGVQIPTIDFFARYGNVYSIGSQYLAALDRNAVHLIHPVKSFIGVSFFDNYAQEATGHNIILNNLIRTTMSGKSDSAIYEFRGVQRLTTGYPIFVEGKPEYFAFIITPTASIYTNLNDVLFAERFKMFSLIAGTTAAVLVLIIFLIKWNNILNKEVKRRTEQLEESNRQISISNQQLALTNEQLKIHDRMQKEFINIASHEMKTPTQAILGFSDLLEKHPRNRNEIVQGIQRNAARLHRLTNDILDVTRIESNTLKLNKEKFNLNDVIMNCLNDVIVTKNINNGKHIKLLYEPKDIIVEGDKARISQVISNLLSNAIKFTNEGNISVISKQDDGNVTIRIKDTGTGVDSNIFPRLFNKFATKSNTGTGLGLFISKSIVEAHDGRIWAENNSDGSGATFSFTLPINQ